MNWLPASGESQRLRNIRRHEMSVETVLYSQITSSARFSWIRPPTIETQPGFLGYHFDTSEVSHVQMLMFS